MVLVAFYMLFVSGGSSEAVVVESKFHAADSDGVENVGIYSHIVNDIHGNAVDLQQYAGHVSLIVNLASNSERTDMTYTQLNELYSKYHSVGLEILGFPSNDFDQEPGGNDEIWQFAHGSFGVTFPLFEKAHVVATHPMASPVYAHLAKLYPEAKVQHNFFKYLVDKDGQVVHLYPKRENPATFEGAIQELLAAR